MLSAAEFKKQYIDDWKPTPLIEVEGVLFKQEEQNPTGSVKSRGLVWQIHSLIEKQHHQAVISSSGNAALAAAYYAEKAGILLHVFVPYKLDPDKLALLKEYGADVTVTDEAITKALKFSNEKKLPIIRQSLDPIAPKGFERIALELDEQLKEMGYQIKDSSVFFPVSSGTTLLGFSRGVGRIINEELDNDSIVQLSNQRPETYELVPQLHAVQTQAVQTIAKEFDTDVKRIARSIVPGIVARKVANTYKKQVVEAIKQSNGSGWVITDEQVLRAHDWLEHNGIASSLEGALALAGCWKALKSRFELKRHPVVILT